MVWIDDIPISNTAHCVARLNANKVLNLFIKKKYESSGVRKSAFSSKKVFESSVVKPFFFYFLHHFMIWKEIPPKISDEQYKKILRLNVQNNLFILNT